MFRSDDTIYEELYVRSIRDLLPEKSDVYLYIDLFAVMDFSRFECGYALTGERPISPQIMLRTIFYGLTHGVVSGHKLAAACQFDARFRVLSGDQKPDRRTFDRFFDRHGEAINAFFVDIVRLAQKMGLVSLGRVAIDGSHFKANTSKHKAMSYAYMEKAIATIEAELAQLRASLKEENARETTLEDSVIKGEMARRERRLAKITAAKKALEEEARAKGQEQVDPKAQKSFADHDACPAKKGGKEFQYAYNVQVGADELNQIIVAADLHPSANDCQALLPLIDEVTENCGKAPEEALADSGYKSIDNLAGLEERGVIPTIAMGKGESETQAHLAEHLAYDEASGKYHCPAGRPLKSYREKRGMRVELIEGHCRSCPRAENCPLFAQQGRSTSLPHERSRAALARNAQRLRTPEGKESYRRRKAIVEPVFGNMKNKGMKILVRGKEKVLVRIKLFASAHNIEKIIGAMASKGAVAAAG